MTNEEAHIAREQANLERLSSFLQKVAGSAAIAEALKRIDAESENDDDDVLYEPANIKKAMAYVKAPTSTSSSTVGKKIVLGNNRSRIYWNGVKKVSPKVQTDMAESDELDWISSKRKNSPARPLGAIVAPKVVHAVQDERGAPSRDMIRNVKATVLRSREGRSIEENSVNPYAESLLDVS